MPTAVRAREIGRRFAGRWALSGVSVEVEAGESVLLYGPNGAGKTTLLRVLSSAIAPTRGEVEIFGKPAIEQRAMLALLTHADGHYDELSGFDNLELAARLGNLRGDVPRLLDRVGLGARGGDPVRTYSAGMRKRLSFARLLLKAPQVAMFDEPYAALDGAGHTFVDELFAELRARGATVIVSTHQVSRVAPMCHRAVRIDAGKIVWQGAGPDAVRTTHALDEVAPAPAATSAVAP